MFILFAYHNYYNYYYYCCHNYYLFSNDYGFKFILISIIPKQIHSVIKILRIFVSQHFIQHFHLQFLHNINQITKLT